MKHCIVLVSDENYIKKCFQTILEIRTVGKYNGEIVLLPHPELKNNLWFEDMCDEFQVNSNFFEIVNMDNYFQKIKERPFDNSFGFEFNKKFQWHKFHLFDPFFKKWDYVFYIDVGMKIFDDINIFWDLKVKDKLVAHSDGYPTYNEKLKSQFNRTSYPEVYEELSKLANMEGDAFQSTMMIYDTNIISDNTKETIIELANKYYVSRYGDQNMLNIYFNGIHNLWEPLKVKYNDKFTYDFWERDDYKFKDYVMLKYPKTL